MEENIIKRIETSDGTQYKIEGQLPVVECTFVRMIGHDDINSLYYAIPVPSFLENVMLAEGYEKVSEIIPEDGEPKSMNLDKSENPKSKKEGTKAPMEYTTVTSFEDLITMGWPFEGETVNVPNELKNAGTYLLKGTDDYGNNIEVTFIVQLDHIFAVDFYDYIVFNIPGIQFSMTEIPSYRVGNNWAVYTGNIKISCELQNGTVKYYYYSDDPGVILKP